MRIEASRRVKPRMFLAGLLIFAAVFQFAPTNASGQTISTRLSRFLAERSIKPNTAIKANYSYSPRYPVAGQSIQFTDVSTGNPTAWHWDFGDGTTSADRNPLHVYATAGFRRVTLTVTNDTVVKRSTKALTVMPESSGATFVFSPATPGPGQPIQFADTTSGNPTAWQWDFGDGTRSTAKNPSHAYARAASYVVTLVATNSSGSKHGSQAITVTSISVLSSSFTYAPASPTAGQAVQFTDTSVGTPTSWQWNFGDGTTSTAQNPSHAYTTAGSRNVTLTVSNGSSSNTATRTISVTAALRASFNSTPSSPTAGQAVQFTDTSAGTPTSWQWNFGDGTTSTAQNPSHAYTTAGSRTVTLTVSNSSSSDTATQSITIVAVLTSSFTYTPASPAVGQSVQFTDSSTGTPTLWQWNFGDGATSVARNPSHTYLSSGSYAVTLTVMNGSDQDATSQTIYVVPASSLTASFSYSPSSAEAGQTMQFTDTSTGSPTSWAWDFSDGTTSTNRNPSHAFAAAGSYPVVLVAGNGSISSTAVRTVTVIPAALPVASFTFNPNSPTAGQSVAFTDASAGNPTVWQWDFGDGSTASAQSPRHTFAAEGSYNVLLSVTNSRGSDSTRQVISVSSGQNSVHYAASPSSTAIQAAIDAASDGDTVQVPAGTATWTSNVTIPATKGVRLIGAGIDNTSINLGGVYALYIYPRAANQPVRVSGFSFTNCAAPSLQINDYSIGSNNWRIDHCSWTNGPLGTEINVHGYTFGVIDNCIFTNTLRTFWVDAQVRPFDTSGSPMPYPGGYSWQQPVTMGGADAVYIEDCTIHNTSASIFHNMRGGARFVFRHNTITGLNGLETHSGCTPGYRNPRWIEIYENTFDLQGLGSYWCGLFLRSTNGVVFNNRFSAGYATAIQFDNETTCMTSCINPWPSANRSVYPAQDQIGAGRDTGWGTRQATDEAKLWIWGNTRSGSNVSPNFSGCANSGSLVQFGRDYFLSAPPTYSPYAYPHPLRNY